MNLADILLGAIILIFLVRGMFRGLFREGIGLIGILIGLIVAVNRYQDLGAAIGNEFRSVSITVCNILSFAIIFGGIAILGAIAGILIHNFLYKHSIRGIEEGGGFVLGLFEGALVCSVLLILFYISPFSAKFDTWSERSILKPYLIRVAPFVYDSIVSFTPGEAKNFMEKLDLSELKLPTLGDVE